MPRRIRRLLFALILAGMATVAAAILLELLMRLADPLHIGETVERERFAAAVLGQREDGTLRLNPGSRGELFGHEHVIGPQGFRTPDFARERADGTFRIVIVGDSVAFGWGVAAADAFPRVVERTLQQRIDAGEGPSGIDTAEVINLSTPGWGVPHYVRCVDEIVATLDAQLVIVTLINNDLTDVLEALGAMESGPAPEPLPGWIRWSWAARALDRLAAVATAAPEQGDYTRDDRFFADLAALGDAVPRAEQHLVDAFEMLRERLGGGTTLAVMDTVTDGADHRLDVFAAGLAAKGIPRFEAFLPTDGDPRRFAVGATDDHPNASGHRIVAETVVDWITSHAPWHR